MNGTLTMPVDIGGRSLKLVFKFGTLRLAERELNQGSLLEVFGAGNFGMEATSAIFWAVLQPAHAMTREAADNLIDEAGFDQVLAWIREGMAAIFLPKPEQLADVLGEAKAAETPPPEKQAKGK